MVYSIENRRKIKIFPIRAFNPYKISPSSAPFGFAQGKAQGKAF
jgi:hypothetical protein